MEKIINEEIETRISNLRREAEKAQKRVSWLYREIYRCEETVRCNEGLIQALDAVLKSPARFIATCDGQVVDVNNVDVLGTYVKDGKVKTERGYLLRRTVRHTLSGQFAAIIYAAAKNVMANL